VQRSQAAPDFKSEFKSQLDESEETVGRNMNPHAQELRQLRSKVNEGKNKLAQIEREFTNQHSRGS